jgi:hypothetical protein
MAFGKEGRHMTINGQGRRVKGEGQHSSSKSKVDGREVRLLLSWLLANSVIMYRSRELVWLGHGASRGAWS